MVREEIAAGRAQASGLIDSLKGIARTSVEIGKILFFIFLVIFIVTFVMGIMRG